MSDWDDRRRRWEEGRSILWVFWLVIILSFPCGLVLSTWTHDGYFTALFWTLFILCLIITILISTPPKDPPET